MLPTAAPLKRLCNSALPLVRIVLQHRSVVAFAVCAVNIGRTAAVGGKSTLRLNTIAVGYLGDVDVEFG